MGSKGEGRVLAGIESGSGSEGRGDGGEEGAEMGEGEEMEERERRGKKEEEEEEDQPRATCIVASLRLPNSERG